MKWNEENAEKRRIQERYEWIQKLVVTFTVYYDVALYREEHNM